MSTRRPRPIKDYLFTGIIVVGGLAAGYLGFGQARDQLGEDVLDSSRHSAVAFQSPDVPALTGTRDDLKSDAYAAVLARLHRFQETDAKVRGLRIFRYLPASNRSVVLAAAAPGGGAALQPGDTYPAVAGAPPLQASLRAGEPVLDGPHDAGGETVLTGYAPIGAKPAPGVPRDFLAIDITAPHRFRDLALAAISPAVLVWVILGLPFVGFILVRREVERGEAIRNLSEAVEQSRGAVMIIGLEGDIEYANRGFCEQIGTKRRELIGKNWRNFQAADTPATDVADLILAVKSGRAWTGEWFNRRQDGTVYPVRGAFTPVRRRNGKLACFIATFDDVTELKYTEKVLRESKERAEAGETAKSQFLSTMSHEVRTPLNGIIGFTSLLLDTEMSPEQREYVQAIQLSSEALIQLTSDILDFARIESHKLKLEPQPCAPRECVEDALDLVATKAAAKGIELLHWVDDSVPETIHADSNRLRQVLINLIGNAVKFTEKGEVEVRVRAERGPVMNDHGEIKLIFSVRDTGIGIAPDQHARLFKPFTLLDNALTRRHGGTGLGLSISKNIVELMGGEVFLKSELGRGSTFSFTLMVDPHPSVTERRPVEPLGTLKLAIAAPDTALRAELVRVGRRFGASVVETAPAALAATPGWDVALVDLDPARIAELIAAKQPAPGLSTDRLFGLVPLSLPSATRNALRAHFRLLVNKPVHHDGLYAMLATTVAGPVVAPPKRDTAGLNVLLVEDDNVNQLLMQRQLTSLGCHWSKAENGHVALQEIERQAFDFILMDLYMPEMDGVDAIRQIRAGRAGEAAKDVWIAALTADARADQKDRTLDIGANDYLVKPVSLPELRLALERFVLARRPHE